jgi:replication factor A3
MSSDRIVTPRITAVYLDNYVDRTVLLLGKVTQLRGDQATIDSEGAITVILNRDCHLVNGSVAQIIGKVNNDASIKVLQCKDLGPNIDLGLFSAVVKATHTHRSIFLPNDAN